MNGQKEELTYTIAVSELEQIIGEMEDASISMDELSAKVKRAAQLLHFCRNRLTSTELEVNNILKGFEDADNN